MSYRGENHVENIMTKEIIEKLRKNGYDDIVDAVLNDEKKCIFGTNKRLNLSALGRMTKRSLRSIRLAIEEMRILLTHDR